MELFDEFEHQFETTGYYGTVAGYGINMADYDKIIDRIIALHELELKNQLVVNK